MVLPLVGTTAYRRGCRKRRIRQNCSAALVIFILMKVTRRREQGKTKEIRGGERGSVREEAGS